MRKSRIWWDFMREIYEIQKIIAQKQPYCLGYIVGAEPSRTKLGRETCNNQSESSYN